MRVLDHCINFSLTQESLQDDYGGTLKVLDQNKKNLIQHIIKNIYSISEDFKVPIVIFPITFREYDDIETYTKKFVMNFRIGIAGSKLTNYMLGEIPYLETEIARLFTNIQKKESLVVDYEKDLQQKLLNDKMLNEIGNRIKKDKLKKSKSKSSLNETDFFD